ncbi:MAG: type IV pilin protein [Eubacteriales bacterium]
MKKNAKKGFTIVELVIVIAVIGILAAVLIPTFGGVIDKANRSAALQVATSVMKSTLAMSDTAALSAETIFAIGDANGINYEFKYVGNKIQATEIKKLYAIEGRRKN